MKRSDRFFFPEKSYCSVRGSEALYFSADTGAAVKVNAAGRVVLEACRAGGTIDQIARRLAGGRRSLEPVFLPSSTAFLLEMVERGFLQAGRSSRAPLVPPVREAVPDQLSQLYLHVTDACNLRCVYCYNAEQRSSSRKQPQGKQPGPMTASAVFDLLDQAASLQTEEVIFTGGEPLCRKELPELAAYAQGQGLSTALLTNGTLIDKRLAGQIAGCFDTVVVSVDSWVEEEYERLQPGASHGEALAGIANLVDAGVAQVVIRPVVTAVNLASLPQFPRFAADRFGCSAFLLALYLPNAPAEIEALGLLPEPEVYWDTLASFNLELKRVGGVSIADCIPLEASGSCGAGTSVLSVAANGDVYPCQCLHYDEYLAGNAQEKSIAEIVASSAVLDGFRRERWPWFGACGDCALMTLCASTCRVFNRVFRQKEEAFFEWLCPFFKREIEDKLWREVGQSKSDHEMG